MRRYTTSVLLMAMVIAATTLWAETKSSQGAALGTWKLDLKKSDFGQMPPPKSVVVTVTQDTPAALKWRAVVVDDKGKKTTESFAGAPDGKEYSLKGGENGDMMMSYKNDDGVIKATGKAKDGSTIEQTITLSDDKNTMTLKATASGPKGEMNWTEVYDRVGSGHAKASAAKKGMPANRLKK